MDKGSILNRINSLLEEENFPEEISDISDLEDFLSDENNIGIEAYDEIEQLYNQLLGFDEEDQ